MEIWWKECHLYWKILVNVMHGIRMPKMIYCPKDRDVRTSGGGWKDEFKT
jgi:hypothetical protein